MADTYIPRIGTVKDCPYCGNSDNIDNGGFSFMFDIMWNGKVRVKCANSKCFALGPLADTKKKAVAKWNKRKNNNEK